MVAQANLKQAVISVTILLSHTNLYDCVALGNHAASKMCKQMLHKHYSYPDSVSSALDLMETKVIYLLSQYEWSPQSGSLSYRQLSASKDFIHL